VGGVKDALKSAGEEKKREVVVIMNLFPYLGYAKQEHI